MKKNDAEERAAGRSGSLSVKARAVILTAVFIIAAAIMLYPLAANIYNGYVESSMVVEYEESVSGISEDDYTEMIEAAQAWNEELYAYVRPSYFPDGFTNNEIYESLLNLNGDGMIGYVVIPKIDVSLPIYHYTTDEVLAKGAGHMQASSLPVGGENTHCVITAHRGLPSATMFSDLDELEIGDVFYLKVLDEILEYEVVEIQEVDPDETTSLMPESGRDLCTLVTCTPYGVNTKRLLVTGERTEYDGALDSVQESSDAVEKAVDSYWYLLACAGAEALAYAFAMARLLKGGRKSKGDAA